MIYKKSKIEKEIERVFEVTFAQFIEKNFVNGDSRNYVASQIYKMSLAKNMPIKTSSSSIYYKVIELIDRGEIKKFKWDIKNRGNKPKTRKRDVRFEVYFICNSCGKKHINKEIDETEVNLRSYQCPSCKSFASCDAIVMLNGKKGLRKIKEIPLGNTGIMVKRTVWVDEKDNVIDSPFVTKRKKAVQPLSTELKT